MRGQPTSWAIRVRPAIGARVSLVLFRWARDYTCRMKMVGVGRVGTGGGHVISSARTDIRGLRKRAIPQR